MAFVRPLMAAAESNLVILTAAGAVIPLVVVERREGAVDAVVRTAPERPCRAVVPVQLSACTKPTVSRAPVASA